MDPENNMSISFFVPCLNEENNIAFTLDRILDVMRKYDHSYEILVFDDSSTDDSVAKILEWRATHEDISLNLLQNPCCRGLGRNYFLAAHRARGLYYMLVNGDGSEPPATINSIISHMGEADAIIPYFGLNDTRTHARRFLSVAFTFIVNMLSGHRLNYYNGPVLHRTENVQIWFAETAGFGYQAELLCRLLGEGISYIEIQVTNSDRETGASKAMRFQNLLSVANTLFHVFLRRLENMAFKYMAGVKR
ncbi:MAG: glycosyltransferase family 2 protein [Nitrospinota bacterium]|nr:glycosyltransferase family 2 protein [Nitrospinota bacterium]MDP7661906.1 glycosyltransferase family 2 protein [Nitrospinota bacterium]